MFSDAVEIVEDLMGTLSRVSSASERIDRSYSSYVRRTVIGFITKMGSEEYYNENGPVRSALLAVVSGAWKPIQNLRVEYKIRYVESLFSMVPDNQVSLFYSELRKGLDNVIRAWDDSEQDPFIVWYNCSPQRIKNRFTYRVIK